MIWLGIKLFLCGTLDGISDALSCTVVQSEQRVLPQAIDYNRVIALEADSEPEGHWFKSSPRYNQQKAQAR